MDTHPELAIIQVDIAQPHAQQLGGACPGTDVASQQCPARGAAHLGQQLISLRIGNSPRLPGGTFGRSLPAGAAGIAPHAGPASTRSCSAGREEFAVPGCLSPYNSQVLANATGLGCNCSDDMLTSSRTHMSGHVGAFGPDRTVRAWQLGIPRVLDGIEVPMRVQRRRCW